MYVIVTVIAIVVSIIAGIFANKRDRNVVPLTLTTFFSILILILLVDTEEVIIPFFTTQE